MKKLNRYPLAIILLAAGCAHPAIAPLSPQSPKEARAAAARAEPAEAADLAWLAGNDRAYALQRLSEALAKDGGQLDLRLRRVWLRRMSEDREGLAEDIAAMLKQAPNAPQTQAALLLLNDSPEVYSRDLKDALQNDPALAEAEARPQRVILSARLGARVHRWVGELPNQEALDRAGLLRKFTAIGPLPPLRDRLIPSPPSRYETAARWPAPERYQGRPAPVRELSSQDATVRVATGGVFGRYVLETWVHLPAEAEALLYAELPSPGRVWVDDRLAITRDPAPRRVPELLQAALQMQAGWHRLRVATELGGDQSIAIALLGEDGAPVFDKKQRERPEAAPGAATLLAAVPAGGEGSAAAYAAALAADEDTALFGRLLMAELALRNPAAPLSTAAAALDGLERARPESAAALFERARLELREGLPMAKAKLQFEAVLKQDPGHPLATTMLVERQEGEELERNVERIEALRAAAPESYLPDALLFRLYRSQGWIPEAARAVKEAAARGAPAVLRLSGARLLFEAGRPREAAKLAEQARALGLPVQQALDYAIFTGDAAAVKRLLAGEAPWAKLMRAKLHLQGSLQGLDKLAADPAGALRLCVEVLRADPLNQEAALLALKASLRIGSEPGAVLGAEWLRRIGLPSLNPEVWLSSIGLAPRLDAPSGYDPWPRIRVNPKTGLAPGLDPKDRWYGADKVILRRRMVDRVLPNGAAITRFHDVLRLQTKAAADDEGELQLPDGVLPLQLRTLKTDGSAVDVSRHDGLKTVSFTALAPGDATEQEWVALRRAPDSGAGYSQRFAFMRAAPAEELEFEVVLSIDQKLSYHAYNGAPEPTITKQGELLHYRWTARNVDALRPEPRAVPAEEFIPFVFVQVDPATSTAEDHAVGTLRMAAQGSDKITRFAKTLVKEGQSPLMQARAVLRWVDDNIEPGPSSVPSLTLGRRAGRRDGLYAALLRALGIKAELYLLHPGVLTLPQSGLPTEYPFRAVRVEAEGSTQWALLDGAPTTFGALPRPFTGGQMLHLSPSGASTLQPIPPDEIAGWGVRTVVKLSIDRAGDAQGSLQLDTEGGLGAGMRRFLRDKDAATIKKVLQGWIGRVLPGAQLEDYEVAGHDSALEPIGLTLKLRVTGYMSPEGGYLSRQLLFPYLPGTTLGFGLPLQAYLGTATRATPMLLQPTREALRVELSLPPGAGAPIEAPPEVDRTTRFGRFTQRFEVRGRTLVLERSEETPLMRVPPDQYEAFAEFALGALQAGEDRLVVPLD